MTEPTTSGVTLALGAATLTGTLFDQFDPSGKHCS